MTEADIDGNLRGVFRVMIKLGMLEPAASDPYCALARRRRPTAARTTRGYWPKNKALARKVTDESIVLLKNEGGLLPLKARRSRALPSSGRWQTGLRSTGTAETPPYIVTPLAGFARAWARMLR